ncbi:MAG: LamG-like jellyroll fold domain-containing protein [Candidatus Neomarinimicrobiota bacterium]
MEFHGLINRIIKQLGCPLPREKAHDLMWPSTRFIEDFPHSPENATPAAVLILLYAEYEKIHFFLTERSQNVAKHKGQISLPGGVREAGEIPTWGTETYPISHGSWEERWKFSFMGNRRVRYTVNTENGIIDLDSSTLLDTSIYYFVAGVYNGSHMKLYINGQLEQTSALTGNINQTGLDLTISQQKPAVTNYNYRGELDDIRIYSIAVTDSTIASLYYTELSAPVQNLLPGGFHLADNYPNPFNPVTTIEFSLPGPAHVKLSILNLLGQTVAVPVNTNYPGGDHNVRWDAGDFPSGVYFYRIYTSEFSDIKKCLIIK